MKREVKVLLLLMVLVPLGVFAGGAWGEWGREELLKLLGFVPSGFDRLSGFWKAPFADYSIPGVSPVISYLISAVIGAVLVMLVFAFSKKDKR